MQDAFEVSTSAVSPLPAGPRHFNIYNVSGGVRGFITVNSFEGRWT